MSSFPDVSGGNSVPMFRVFWWCGRTKINDSSVFVLPNYQHTLEMGTDLAPETSEKRHILTRLCA